MQCYTFRDVTTGLEVLVTWWDPEDIVTTVLSPTPNPAPEVALRPPGARTWGPPLRLERSESTSRS